MENLQGILGLGAILLGCAAFSTRRSAIQPALVAKSLGLQIVLAILLLKLPGSQHLFWILNKGIEVLQDATRAGTSFIFGHIGGGAVPYEITDERAGVILAFQTLPMVIVISVLSGLLVYSGILTLILRAMSLLLERTLRIGSAPGFAIVANAFLGMVEAPLLIRPYLARLGSSELFMVMVAGMATIAGSMMAIEAAVIGNVLPDAAGHLFSASLITLPGVVYVSHLLMPHTGRATGRARTVDRGGSSIMDVVAKSTQIGLQIFLNIIAMAIVVVALVYLLNAFLGLLPEWGGRAVTMERLLGYALAPLTWLMGIAWRDILLTGELLGAKTVLTEFIAYVRLGELPPEAMSARSRTIITYALCGFANFISLGIMVTGLITMVPERREEIIGFGFKSLVAGSLATFSSACIVGVLLAGSVSAGDRVAATVANLEPQPVELPVREAGFIGFVQQQDLEPQPFESRADVVVKRLSDDPETGRLAVLARFPAGFERSGLAAVEQSIDLVMLSGALMFGDELLEARDFAFIPPGSRPPNVASESGAEALTVLPAIRCNNGHR